MRLTEKFGFLENVIHLSKYQQQQKKNGARAHFCYKLVHYGTWDWCIVGFVRWICSFGQTFRSPSLVNWLTGLLTTCSKFTMTPKIPCLFTQLIIYHLCYSTICAMFSVSYHYTSHHCWPSSLPHVESKSSLSLLKRSTCYSRYGILIFCLLTFVQKWQLLWTVIF